MNLTNSPYSFLENTDELCNGETFRPRCSGGTSDVIIMLTARYGRMNFGRCLEEDPELSSMMDNPRFVGCSSDVKNILDQQCTGHSECNIRINDHNFNGVQPCLEGLKMHLEASYICIKGEVYFFKQYIKVIFLFTTFLRTRPQTVLAITSSLFCRFLIQCFSLKSLPKLNGDRCKSRVSCSL